MFNKKDFECIVETIRKTNWISRANLVENCGGTRNGNLKQNATKNQSFVFKELSIQHFC